jgi:hypothetical protein
VKLPTGALLMVLLSNNSRPTRPRPPNWASSQVWPGGYVKSGPTTSSTRWSCCASSSQNIPTSAWYLAAPESLVPFHLANTLPHRTPSFLESSPAPSVTLRTRPRITTKPCVATSISSNPSSWESPSGPQTANYRPNNQTPRSFPNCQTTWLSVPAPGLSTSASL